MKSLTTSSTGKYLHSRREFFLSNTSDFANTQKIFGTTAAFFYFLTWYVAPSLMLALSILPMDSAALTGTVDFSTTILCCPGVTMSAMSLAARSTYFRSGALPFP